MSAKSMLLRMFRRPQATDTNTIEWLIEVDNIRSFATPDAASIPMPMRTATPEEVTAMETTTIIPAINEHTERVAYELESATDDDDFCTRAAAALKLGSWQDVFAGLNRYFALHPAEMQEPVAA